MKTFKNIEELKEEKRRLRRDNKDLETKISKDWDGFKHSLRPANLLNQVISRAIEKHKEKNETAQLISDSVVSIATKATKVLTSKLEQKLDKWLDK